MRPPITGETHSGRSIREMSRERPRKVNRVTAQAAKRPKIALSGTTIAAVKSVNCTA